MASRRRRERSISLCARAALHTASRGRSTAALGVSTDPSMRLKVGDVIEIEVDGQLAYAHYSHKHKTYGALLRVMPSLFSVRPVDFASVLSQEPQFLCFFPLAAAIRQGLVTRVATEPLSPAATAFPVFRASVRTPSGWGPWWLWDGEEEWRVGALEPGMERLPIRGVIDDTLLIDRIRSRWRAENDA